MEDGLDVLARTQTGLDELDYVRMKSERQGLRSRMMMMMMMMMMTMTMTMTMTMMTMLPFVMTDLMMKFVMMINVLHSTMCDKDLTWDLL